MKTESEQTEATQSMPNVSTKSPQKHAMGILFALSFSHLLNDSLQAIIPAAYPLVKQSFGLTFTQIGLITLAFQMSGSIFQPVVGFYTDRNPKPYSLVFGMCLTLIGLVTMAYAPSYAVILMAATMIGLGSAIFHPESSRMARLASGGQHGLAQSLFQVGGNIGTAAGPLLAAWIIVPNGQRSIVLFAGFALTAMFVLSRVGKWYAAHLDELKRSNRAHHREKSPFDKKTIAIAMAALLVLIFSKFFYLVSFTNYYTFYLMAKFGLSIQTAQFYLFLFLFAVAAGTIIGGPVGDRIGRRAVIWISILGISPFSLLLPHMNLFWTAALSMIVGFIMSSAFPAILVFAIEMLPGNVGLVAGLFFGLAFGMAGIGAAALGKLADATSIAFVVKACAFLPLLGLFTAFLPRQTKAELKK